jgi:RNA polymerase sigma-54 factor
MLNQSLQQKLLQKLSPQQIQLMKLLQVPTIALEQRIKEEMELNPALEDLVDEDENTDDFDDYDADTDDQEEQDDDDILEHEIDDYLKEKEKDEKEDFDFSMYMDDIDDPDYKYQIQNKSRDEEEKTIPFASGETFQERLESQLGLRRLSEKQVKIAVQLIGSLDESGYLRRELEDIVDDLAFTQNLQATEDEIEEVLRVIQDLEPAGVGARDLQECLQIQIDKRIENEEKTVELLTAQIILEDYFEEFSKKHYDKIQEKLEISEEDLKVAVNEILKLNPRPGNSMSDSSGSANVIIPDFMLEVREEELFVTLNSRNAPELRVSRQYADMLQHYQKTAEKNRAEKEALMFVKSKLDSAKWFIDAIKQRQHTLQVTINAIVEHQREYFLDGDETKLKPMILKDIADRINMDISTVSRVANSKYITTPYGTFLLKSFFSESLSTESGEEVSTREVKRILQDIIEGESKKKPYADDKLAKMLKQKGYNIARRTVAKYREQLNIPVARLRKEI